MTHPRHDMIDTSNPEYIALRDAMLHGWERVQTVNPPTAQCVILPSDLARTAFRPDLIMIVSNIRLFGRYDIDSLESWAFNRDLEAWDYAYPDDVLNHQ